MENLINPDFQFHDECETIANYMEEHLYNTIMWQLPLDVESDFYGDENYANEMHAEAMEQVIAIMATRINGLADKIEDYYYYKSNTK